jgi:hypothetical protein
MPDDSAASARLPASALSLVPLMVAYVLLPLAGAAARLLPWKVAGAAPPFAVWAWTLLAGAALLWAVWERAAAEGEGGRARTFGMLMPLGVSLTAGLLLTGLLVWAGPRAATAEHALRWLGEFAPLIYLLLAWAWSRSHGLPARGAFLAFGAALAAFVLLDFSATLLRHGLTAPEGWLAGGGLLTSGGVGGGIGAPGEEWFGPGYGPGYSREAAACLLAVALFAAVREKHAPGRLGPAAVLALACILLGLAATFSRTALFASAGAWFFLGPGPRLLRAAAAAFLLACAALALFAAPLPPADVAELTGPLLWMSGVERFAQSPEALFYARGLGPFALTPPVSAALALGLPLKVQLLEPAQITSLWLRLVLVWGVYGVAAFAVLLAGPTLLRPSRMAAGVVALALAQGTVYSLFYDPCAAVVLWLGLLAGAAQSQQPENAASAASQAGGPAKDPIGTAS